MTDLISIAVDAMGGDDAPDVVLEGVAQALSARPFLNVLLCGPEDVVVPFAEAHDRCTAVPCSEVIAMDEHPANAVRTKKDSSIVVGCRLVREGKAQGFFLAGSTGACLAAATLVMGRAKGVKRPALGVVLPAYDQPVFFADVGANADCKPEYLVQFAKMGAIYMEHVMGVSNPQVGLLNIGEEDTKGSSLALGSYELLRQEVPEFKGNCEGGDLLAGKFSVVVTDGFTGNVCLKTIEGTSKMIFRHIKSALTSSLTAKMGAALVKGSLAKLKEDLNPDRFGGTPLLGVKGTCIVGHGSSNAEAIKNGVIAACTQVEGKVSERIAEAFANAPGTPASQAAPEEGSAS